MLHDSAFGAEGGQRHATANHLAHHRHVGFKAGDFLGINALCAAQRHPETSHHLIKNQQCAVLGAELATAFHKWHAGAHKVHVAANGFHHQAGNFAALHGKGFLQLLNVVVFQHHCVLHHFRRHAGAGRVAKSGQT